MSAVKLVLLLDILEGLVHHMFVALAINQEILIDELVKLNAQDGLFIKQRCQVSGHNIEQAVNAFCCACKLPVNCFGKGDDDTGSEY